MNIDPYDILGVARDSGPAEWKRAYRRLAMRWHPDRNDHPEATERFKVINAAYELIATVGTEKEAKTESPENDEPANEAPAAEAEDSVARAADIRLNLDVSLEEAAAGCRKTIHVTRGKACPTCDGSGEAGMARTHFCDACHGSGRVHDAHRRLIKCDACDGRGLIKERTCPDCEGSGRELAEVSLKITVPPGMLPGDELRLAGQGEPGDDELEAGHLYLTLVIRSHPPVPATRPRPALPDAGQRPGDDRRGGNRTAVAGRSVQAWAGSRHRRASPATPGRQRLSGTRPEQGRRSGGRTGASIPAETQCPPAQATAAGQYGLDG